MNSRGYQVSHEKYQKNLRSLPSTEKKHHVTHVSKQRSPISIKIPWKMSLRIIMMNHENDQDV